MKQHRIAVALAGVAILSATAACGSGGGASSAPSAPGTSQSSSSGSSAPAAAGYNPAHAGGTLHLVANAGAGTLDPQINYTLQYWQLYQASFDGLLAFH